MRDALEIAAWVVLGANAVAAAVGGLAWYRWSPGRATWATVRAGQAAGAVLAVLAGVFFAGGFKPAAGLFWLYALLPAVISIIAEQLRIASAQTVLDQRDLPDAAAVGTLPEAGQREIVLQIVRREIGVMAIAALVVAFLAFRALVEV